MLLTLLIDTALLSFGGSVVGFIWLWKAPEHKGKLLLIATGLAISGAATLTSAASALGLTSVGNGTSLETTYASIR
jgi:hypothetical protein